MHPLHVSWGGKQGLCLLLQSWLPAPRNLCGCALNCAHVSTQTTSISFLHARLFSFWYRQTLTCAGGFCNSVSFSFFPICAQRGSLPNAVKTQMLLPASLPAFTRTLLLLAHVRTHTHTHTRTHTHTHTHTRTHRTSTAQLLTRMARQRLLVDDSHIEQEREVERQDRAVIVPQY